MKTFDLDNCSVLESFEGLQYGETVYSKKYGLGRMRSFHNEDIIVQFPKFIKRFAVDDKEIRKIPDYYFKEVNKGVTVSYQGKQMSYTKYKKEVGLTRKGKKEEKLKYITLKETTDILRISKAELFKSIAMNNIQTKTFGRNTMIHRDDLLKLDRVIKA